MDAGGDTTGVGGAFSVRFGAGPAAEAAERLVVLAPAGLGGKE